MYICMHACMYVRMYVYTYICIHIHIYIYICKHVETSGVLDRREAGRVEHAEEADQGAWSGQAIGKRKAIIKGGIGKKEDGKRRVRQYANRGMEKASQAIGKKGHGKRLMFTQLNIRNLLASSGSHAQHHIICHVRRKPALDK